MSDLPRVSHSGTIRIGDLAIPCVVLEDGERGYIQKQLMQTFGFARHNLGAQTGRFLAEFAPKYMESKDKTEVHKVVKMPLGGKANMYPAGLLSELPMNVIKAALNGTLHHKQRHIVPQCLAIAEALAVTGEVALIDEATGYQYHREPDALQDLIGRIIREKVSDWERRFGPDYYASLYKMLGWEYTGQTRHHPLIGWITNEYVYGAIFPAEIMSEIRGRRDKSDKLHQWLEDGGIRLTENQIKAVQMMSDSSSDFEDFKNRCKVTFKVPGQLGFIFPAPGGVA